jgi:cell division protein FtsB
MKTAKSVTAMDITRQMFAAQQATIATLVAALTRCAQALEHEVSSMADEEHPMSQSHALIAAQARAALAAAKVE